MCVCIPNMKFLCLTLCQGEVCTDNINANANDTDANDDRQPNEPKTISPLLFIHSNKYEKGSLSYFKAKRYLFFLNRAQILI